MLNIELPWLDELDRPAKPKRLPVVLTHQEVQVVLEHLSGIHLLMAKLLYGTGMRLTELLQLRIKDIDFELQEIVIRQGKGDKDRITILPKSIQQELKLQIEQAKILFNEDRKYNKSGVYLPNAIEKNIQKQMSVYLGFGYFPHLMNPLIQGQEFLDGIIFIIKVCNAHSKLLCSKRISQNLLHCIR